MTFRMPAEIARIAYWNKKAVYGLLFKASAKTVMTYRHRSQKLGAKEGLTQGNRLKRGFPDGDT